MAGGLFYVMGRVKLSFGCWALPLLSNKTFHQTKKKTRRGLFLVWCPEED